jgi:HAD superfamily hydrolase (TIGR01509 family)
MTCMALDALIFDIDGTLVDSNPAHVLAWRRAFASRGYDIPEDRIEIEIGKGGDQLVPSVLGPSADKKDGDALRAAEPKEFAKIVADQPLKPFKGAVDLLDATRAAGLKVILATSSGPEQLKTLQRSAGVDLEGLADVIANSADAEKSKPHPAIVSAAVAKAGLSPAQCAMLGDAPYDMTAAKHAGVVGLGLLTGYSSRETLKRAGARGVCQDVNEVLKRFDEIARLASPAPIKLTAQLLETLMGEALGVAREALGKGEAPIGCVLANGLGHVVARAHNQLNATADRTAHAEMQAFRAAAAGKLSENARDLILVSTLEPCVMCLGASMEAAVDTIAYGLQAPADSGTARVDPPQSPESQMPRIVGQILADQSRELFEQFLKIATNPKQIAFAKQLLALT